MTPYHSYPYVLLPLTGNETPEQLTRLGIYRDGWLRLVLFADDRFAWQDYMDLGGRWLTRDQGACQWKGGELTLFSRKQRSPGRLLSLDDRNLQAVEDKEFFYGPYVLKKLDYPQAVICKSVVTGEKNFSNSLTPGKAYIAHNEPQPGMVSVINNNNRLRNYPKELFGGL